MPPFTRRSLLRNSGFVLGSLAASPWLAAMARAMPAGRKFRLGACDWSLGKKQDPAALDVAREIGLDGVEVSFGKPDQPNDLRDPAVRRHYRQQSEATSVQLASLAMGILNRIPFASDPEAEPWVSDVVDVMPRVGVTICLLAFFSAGDIQGDRAKQDEVIRRLKRVAPKAEKAGVALGVESWMDADEHLRLIEGVGSPAVRVYYDVANMTKRGYNVPQEIRRLGKDRICQFHMKENGALLGAGKVDFPGVRDAILEIGYTGWLILEGAKTQGKSVVECYRKNRKFLQNLMSAPS